MPEAANHEVEDVTYHDFASYIYVLEPWADRQPAPGPAEDWLAPTEPSSILGGRGPASTEETPAATLEVEDLAALDELTGEQITAYIEAATASYAGSRSQMEQAILAVLERFAVACDNELAALYPPPHVPIRRNQMLLHLMEAGLDGFIDRFAQMDQEQRERFLSQYLEVATREWVRRSSYLDRPWSWSARRWGSSNDALAQAATWYELGYEPKEYFDLAPYHDQGLRFQDDYSYRLAWIRPPSRSRPTGPYAGSGYGTRLDKTRAETHFTVLFVPPEEPDPFSSPFDLVGVATDILAEPRAAEEAEALRRDAQGVLSILAGLREQAGGDPDDPQGHESSYGFQPYPARSINLGLQVTYRQEWRPLALATGELIGSIPLGPQQREKVEVRWQRRNRVSRTLEDVTAEETTRESQTQTTTSSELVEEASRSSHWDVQASAQGSINVGLYSAKASVSGGYSRDAANSSRDTKKNVAEAMQRAATTRRRETRATVVREEETVREETRTSEIFNSNDEVAVTYNYHGRQRQYRVHTFLAAVEPVLFIAEPLPAPQQLVQWIKDHDWIVSDVLLDESFRDSLALLHTVDRERIEAEVTEALDELTEIKTALEQARTSLGKLEQLHGSVSDTYGDTLRSYQDAVQRIRDLRRGFVTTAAQLGRLVNHFEDDILHYARAVWRREDPDRRRMRHSKMSWPTRFTAEDVDPSSATDVGVGLWAFVGRFTPVPGSEAPLSELIDPAGPIAFAGNYSVHRIRKTELTSGLVPLVRQTASAYFKETTVSVTASGGAPNGQADVTTADLYDGAIYEVTVVGDANGGQSYEVRVAGPDMTLPPDEVTVEVIPADGGLSSVRLEFRGLTLALDGAPADGATYRLVPSPLTVRDPELAFLAEQYPGKEEEWLKAKLLELNERFLLVDLNAVELQLSISDTSVLERFKQLHRELDVELVETEVERRKARLAKEQLEDPDTERVVVVANSELAAAAAGQATDRSGIDAVTLDHPDG